MPDKNPDMGPIDPAAPSPVAAGRAFGPEALGQDGRRPRRWRSPCWASAGGYGRATPPRHWTDDAGRPHRADHQAQGRQGRQHLTLPGDVQAFTSAPIYAQVSGYVQKWYFDIGAPVKKGQLLAELDTPSLAGQCGAGPRQSGQCAGRAEAVRSHRPRAMTALFDARRHRPPAARTSIDADLAAKNAAWSRRQGGAVQRFLPGGFSTAWSRPLTASSPAATSTMGSLVTVGTPAATPLFTVSDQTKLRIYVRVPQNYASYIRPGMAVTFTVPQYPGSSLPSPSWWPTPARWPAATGTVLVQFGVDNSDGALQPGAYAEVQIPAARRRQRHPCAGHRPDVPGRGHAGGDGGRRPATSSSRP